MKLFLENTKASIHIRTFTPESAEGETFEMYWLDGDGNGTAVVLSHCAANYPSTTIYTDSNEAVIESAEELLEEGWVLVKVDDSDPRLASIYEEFELYED